MLFWAYAKFSQVFSAQKYADFSVFSALSIKFSILSDPLNRFVAFEKARSP